MDRKIMHFQCMCQGLDHLMQFEFDEPCEHWGKNITIEIRINPLFRFRQRIWRGIKYIFGRGTDFGDYDNFLLNKEEGLKLAKAIQEYYE